jgi:hypothetical protein
LWVVKERMRSCRAVLLFGPWPHKRVAIAFVS